MGYLIDDNIYQFEDEREMMSFLGLDPDTLQGDYAEAYHHTSKMWEKSELAQAERLIAGIKYQSWGKHSVENNKSNMQYVKEIEYWRKNSQNYEYLYDQQKEIAQGYKKIIEELQEELKTLNLENATGKNCA
jgi:hypothetical protein